MITHILLIGYGLGTHLGEIGPVLEKYRGSVNQDLLTIGFVGIMAIFLRAFSMGGGTYTGIEAVSNAMNVMREPKVQTGKRTMVYLAVSLAVTAAGLLFCYALFSIKPVEGRTLNAILADRTFSGWPLGRHSWLLLLFFRKALFLWSAPRPVSLTDRGLWPIWLLIPGFPGVFQPSRNDSPCRLAFSSWERLPWRCFSIHMAQYRLSLSCIQSTFFSPSPLSQFGMAKFFFQNRNKDKAWARHIVIHLIGLILCVTILIVTVYEKFSEGGWVTLVITSVLIGLCYLIRLHYLKVRKGVRQLGGNSFFNSFRANS